MSSVTYPSVARPAGSWDVTELNALSTWRDRQWIGGDSTGMCVAPDGKLLIGCGDTYCTEVPIGTTFVGSAFTNNSLLWFWQGQWGVNYSDGGGTNLFGAPDPYIANYIAGFRWPAGGWVDEPTDGRVHFMYRGYDGSIFAGYTPGRLDEVILADDLSVHSITAVPGLDPATVGGNVVEWGAAVWTDGTYTYIFGTWKRTLDGYRLVVARRSAAFGSLPGNTPTFWDGATWNASMSSIVDLGPTPGNSLSVIQHPGGGLLCTSMRKGVLTRTIAAWWAASPEGPWTDLGDIYTVPVEFAMAADQIQYGGLSWVDAGRLRLMWSISANTGAFPQVQANYNLYGVRFAEVDVPARP